MQKSLPERTLLNLKNLPSDLMHCIKECSVFIDIQLKNIREDIPVTSHYQCFSLQKVIDDAVKYYCFTDEERMKLKVEVENIQADSFGDPMAIKHVLYNLFKNALYAIKEAGKGEIHIWVEASADAHKIHIKDTALGMRESIRRKIFHPFYTQSHTGNGLGLAYCQRTMQAHGGEIHCESKEGEYTHFTLSLPAYNRIESMAKQMKHCMSDEPLDSVERALVMALAS